jgi:hypothetical protein
MCFFSETHSIGKFSKDLFACTGKTFVGRRPSDVIKMNLFALQEASQKYFSPFASQLITTFKRVAKTGSFIPGTYHNKMYICM